MAWNGINAMVLILNYYFLKRNTHYFIEWQNGSTSKMITASTMKNDTQTILKQETLSKESRWKWMMRAWIIRECLWCYHRTAICIKTYPKSQNQSFLKVWAIHRGSPVLPQAFQSLPKLMPVYIILIYAFYG